MPEKKKPMDRQRKQAANTDTDETPAITFKSSIVGRDGKTVEVELLPLHEWAFDYQRRINGEDWAGFIEAVCDAENVAKVFKAQPTTGAFDGFLDSIEANTGEDLGESPAS